MAGAVLQKSNHPYKAWIVIIAMYRIRRPSFRVGNNRNYQLLLCEQLRSWVRYRFVNVR